MILKGFSLNLSHPNPGRREEINLILQLNLQLTPQRSVKTKISVKCYFNTTFCAGQKWLVADY